MSFTLRRLAGTAALAVAASALTLPLAAPARATTPTEFAYIVSDLNDDGSFGLYKQATDSSTPSAVVADDTTNATVDVYDLRSSRDGSRVIYVLDTYSALGDPLREKVIVRDVSGRQVRVLADLDANGTTFAGAPALSPDGTTAVWTQINVATHTVSVVRAAVAAGAPAVVVNGYGGPSFLDSTTLFVQTVAGAGYTVPLAGGTPTAAPSFPTGIDGLTVSPDGSHVAWSLASSASAASIQTAALTGTTASATVATVDATGDNYEPSFSQDGSKVYYSRGGALYSGPTDASAPSAAVGTTNADDVAITWTDATAPGAAAFGPAVLGAQGIILKWSLPADTDADLSGVVVTRKYGTTAEKAVYVPLPATSYIDGGLVTSRTYTYEIVATDRSGNPSTVSTRQAVASEASPVVPLPTSTGSAKASFPVSFSPGATPASVKYTVQYRTSASSPWVTWVNNTAGRVRTFGAPASTGVAGTTSTQGKSYQFRALLKDAYGNGSNWSPLLNKANVPYDQTKAAFVGGTTVGSSSSYLGSYRKLWSTSHSAKITLKGNVLYVVGMRCTSCGSFGLYDNGKLIATVSTYATTTKYRQVLFTRGYSTVGTHALVLKPKGTSGHANVMLDGFGVQTW